MALYGNLWNRSKSYLGMECKDSVVKIVELLHTGDGYTIRNFQITSLPAGIIQQGRIEDDDQFIQIIREMMHLAKMRAKSVQLSISSQNVILRPAKLPNLPMKELREVARLEIEMNIQLPFQDPVFDIVPLNKARIRQGEEMDVMLVIAPRQIVMSYVQLLKKLKLKTISVDLTALAHMRVIDWAREGEKADTIMTVNISEYGAEVGVFHNGILKLTRHISLQGAQSILDQQPNVVLGEVAAADAVYDDPIADGAITDGAISNQPTNLPPGRRDDGHSRFAVHLGNEIERVMNFYLYTLNNREQQLDEIVLTGEQVDLRALSEYLAARLQVAASVETLAPFKVHRPVRIDFQRHAAELTIPIGLAMKVV